MQRKRAREKTFQENDVSFHGDYNIFIGPPLQAAFREVLGLDGERLQKIYLEQRARYDNEFIYDFSVYPGVKELLESLTSAGKRAFVVTSKLESQAEFMLERAGLLRYFTALYGQSADGSRLHKLDVMRYALEAGRLDPKDCVMIGDRHFDMNAAKHFGVKGVAALYGYGKEYELAACEPSAFAKDAAELGKLLL